MTWPLSAQMGICDFRARRERGSKLRTKGKWEMQRELAQRKNRKSQRKTGKTKGSSSSTDKGKGEEVAQRRVKATQTHERNKMMRSIKNNFFLLAIFKMPMKSVEISLFFPAFHWDPLKRNLVINTGFC